MSYWQRLWAALLGKPSAYVLHLEERLAAFEKRSQAGRKAHVTRKAKAPKVVNVELVSTAGKDGTS